MAIKSFDQLKAAVEAVALKKYAAESGTPKDPNEVAIPAVSDECMISEKCLDVPEGKANDKAVEKETTSVELKSSEDAPEIKPEEEPTEKVTEQNVAKRGSALLSKLQGVLEKNATKDVVAKEAAAPVANVAEGIKLSEDALAKIASEILATEEGAKFTTNLFRKKAGEEYAAAAIKEATEQARLYKEQEAKAANDPIAKIASELSKLPEEKQTEIARRLSIHASNMEEYEHELLKRAYAAGVEDAEAIMQNPEMLEAAEEPTAEDAGEAEITPEEVMEAVSEMVEAGEISEEQANAIIEEIVAGAEEEAVEEEVADAATEEAVEEANEEAAEKTVEDVEEAAAEKAVEEANDDQAIAEEADVIAADDVAAANMLEQAAAEGPAKLASEIVRGTILLKKASAEAGIADEEEANIQDVVAVIQQLAEEGSISEEEAMAVITEIANAMESEGDELEDEGEAIKHDMEAAKDEVEATEDVADADAEAEDSEEEAEESEEDDEDAEEAVEKVASVLGIK
jgi:polyhydroxyalkanoate synthesis regulator phasin